MRIVIDNLHCKNYFSAQDHTHGVDFTTELREYMKVRANGYQFSPLYQKRQWDGYSHFYTKTDKYATGFLSMVYAKIKELAPAIEITLEDRRTNVPVFKEELTDVLPNTTESAKINSRLTNSPNVAHTSHPDTAACTATHAANKRPR